MNAVDVCNLALSHLGSGNQVVNLETEKSNEAIACRVFYELALADTLADYDWGFANKTVSLALVSENGLGQFPYAYRYPSDCITFRSIYNGLQFDTSENQIPFEIGSDDSGLLILTSQPSAAGNYTKRIEQTSYLPADFVMTLSFKLAFYLAPRITSGDPFKLGDRAQLAYRAHLLKAKVRNANESRTTYPVESSFLRARY